MNLVIEEKQFPLWLVPHASVSDEMLLRLRNANATLHIEREPSGELLIEPIAPPRRK
jgi:hypothetical protein